MKKERLSMRHCQICPHQCHIDRQSSLGLCKAGNAMILNTAQLHHWEEPVISGTKGSGTLFFSYCNLQCVYCQNFRISSLGHGTKISPEELAEKMLQLQEMQAHNINLVTPTHFSPLIAEALNKARKEGLTIPVVWNSNAYELPDTLKELEGLVDIYLPDIRYFQDNTAFRYSNCNNYFSFAAEAVKEMYRQVGHLKIHSDIAWKGLLIRLLILPGYTGEIKKILDWISENPGTKTYISLMGQYYPTHKAHQYPEINRSVTTKEYHSVLEYMEQLGFTNGYIQEAGSSSSYTPVFKE